jgi:signal recognition particle receptor subunit beta
MISLATETDRTLFFDFLPLALGEIRGFKTRFHLYTVPGQVFYDASRKLILKGVDGVVFVADSQIARMEANQESLENLRTNLAEQGYSLDKIPYVMQYNKRDMPEIATVEELRELLNPSQRARLRRHRANGRRRVRHAEGRRQGRREAARDRAVSAPRGALRSGGLAQSQVALFVALISSQLTELKPVKVAREGAARVELALDGGDVPWRPRWRGRTEPATARRSPRRRGGS